MYDFDLDPLPREPKSFPVNDVVVTRVKRTSYPRVLYTRLFSQHVKSDVILLQHPNKSSDHPRIYRHFRQSYVI